MPVISITTYDAFASLRNYLLEILPSSVEVVRAQINRVPEPSTPDFVLMTMLRRSRMATAVQEWRDTLLDGSITSGVLTVSSVVFGPSIEIGQPLFGPAIAPETYVAEYLTGTGGLGTYRVLPVQTVAAGVISAGCRKVSQSTRIDFQLDIHGPNSGDTSQIMSMLAFQKEGDSASVYSAPMLDDTGQVMTDQNGAPLAVRLSVLTGLLDHSDPQQIPFVNAEMQYEMRWQVDVSTHITPIVYLPQEFAGAAQVTFVLTP